MAARRTPLLYGAAFLVFALVCGGVVPTRASDDDTSRSLQAAAALAAAEKDPAMQQALWNKFLRDSEWFAHSHDDSQLWMWRATAALALNRQHEGEEAAAMLTKLGFLDSKVPLVRKLAAALALEGWLRRGAADAGSKGWSGRWVNEGNSTDGKSQIVDCLTIGSDRTGRLNILEVDHFCCYYGKNRAAFLYHYPGPCMELDQSGGRLWAAYGSISAASWSDDHRSLTVTTADNHVDPAHPPRTFVYTLDAERGMLKRNDGEVFNRE